MQQHPLVRKADLQDVTNLVRIEALDVAHGDNGRLCSRELRDRPVDHLAYLGLQETWLG